MINILEIELISLLIMDKRTKWIFLQNHSNILVDVRLSLSILLTLLKQHSRLGRIARPHNILFR
jgi:hypothetical protein